MVVRPLLQVYQHLMKNRSQEQLKQAKDQFGDMKQLAIHCLTLHIVEPPYSGHPSIINWDSLKYLKRGCPRDHFRGCSMHLSIYVTACMGP